MKMLSRGIQKLKYGDIEQQVTTITCEQTFLFFWKRKRKFMATKEYPTGYWNWFRMPNMTNVSNAVSFRLDAWNRLYTKGR